MINSYSIVPKTVLVEGEIPFDVNRILTGCTITHTEGTPSFKLNKPGYYFVSFNADVTGATGTVSAQLLSNAVVVPAAEGTSTLGAVTDVANISFSTIVKVLPSCAMIDNAQTLTVSNVGVEATYDNVNIVITKLC